MTGKRGELGVTEDYVARVGRNLIENRAVGDTELSGVQGGAYCSGMIDLGICFPNRPGRTAGPWRPIVPSVPGRVGMGSRVRHPSSIFTVGL